MHSNQGPPPTEDLQPSPQEQEFSIPTEGNTQPTLKQNFNKYWKLLLSHHPPCDQFSNHTLNLGPIKLCIGCFVGYPSAIIALFGARELLRRNMVQFPTLLIIGIVFYLAQFLSFSRLTERKPVKIGQKILIGSGLGLMLAEIFIYFNPINWTDILIIILLLSLITAPIGILHLKTMKKTCQQCENKNNPAYCPPGFGYFLI